VNKAEVAGIIRDIGIIPAIRVSSAEDAHFAAESVTCGGIPIVEITMTVPEAVKLIAHLVQFHSKMIVGAGTVLNTEMASKCIDAGACFLTGPGVNPKIIEFAAKKDVIVIPGALTPTEVIDAWEAGGDFVKVFPCALVGGDKYIKALSSALPQIPLIAAGGIIQHTAASYIYAGAAAIGVGNELIPPDAIANRESGRIQELAQRFLGFVKGARQRLVPRKEKAKPTTTDFAKLDKPNPHS
jgi:2-dehydro-3-deoxyphosphogluconate aldolase/(4S)-4-hydroxy-2-oxoglutarate aldolase